MRFRRFVRSLFDFVSGTGPRPARRARPRTRQLRIEQLEPRSLLSVNVTGVSLFADTGIDGDQITNDPRLSISTSGMSDYGSAVISLDFDLDGNGQYGDPEDQQGSLSFSDGTNSYVYDPADDPSVSLPDGPIKVRVSVDEFGYGGSGGTTQEFDFVLDTAAPVANVALLNDTGLSQSDGLTKDATLAGTGTAGDTVDVDFDGDGTSDGTTTIDGNGDWSLAPSNLADGQHTATVTVKDAAGNPDATASATFILDTTAPVVTAFSPEQDATLAASPNTATVTFSEAVDLGLLPLSQSVNVTAASGVNVVQSVALGDNDDVVITFNQQLAAGQYTTTAVVALIPDDRGTPGVRDLAGNALDDTQSDHPANASWTVEASSALPTVRIEATDDTATEGDNQDNAEFTITVEGDFAGSLTVQFRVSADSTAEFQRIDHQKPDFKLTGVDFNRNLNLGTVTFLAGSSRTATITLKANRDSLDEGTEEAILELIDGSDYDIATDAATALAFLQDEKVNAKQVVSVDFVQEGTTGILSNDNPDGKRGTPSFLGGWRFFPGAKSITDTSDGEVKNHLNTYNANNVVRIRAEVKGSGIVPGQTLVYFRSFDVDDPSSDRSIDPGDFFQNAAGESLGFDNRGTVQTPKLDRPGASVDLSGRPSRSYQGSLRRAGDPNWGANGAVVSAFVQQVGEKLIAEVELATTFSPGDNFRVLASLNQGELLDLNSFTDVPTDDKKRILIFPGTNQQRKFVGKATAQLSVWRKFHVERDRMTSPNDSDRSLDTRSAQVLAAPQLMAQRGGTDFYRVTVGFATFVTNEWENGLIWNGTTTQDILASSPTGGGQAVLATGQLAQAIAPIGATAQLPVQITSQGQVEENALAGGTLIYRLLAGPGSVIQEQEFQVVSNTAGGPGARITVVVSPLGGQEFPNQLADTGQILVIRNSTDLIVAVPRKENPPALNDEVEVFQDEFVANGANRPTLRRGRAQPADTNDPSSDFVFDAMYNFMQERETDIKKNRFAAAYLEPEYRDLNRFNSGVDVLGADFVPFIAHFNIGGLNADEGIKAGFDFGKISDFDQGQPVPKFRGSTVVEDNLYWTTYATSAFEPVASHDLDPNLTTRLNQQGRENPIFAATINALAPIIDDEVTVIFVETIRDFAVGDNLSGDTFADLLAFNTVHEIGHQFDLAFGQNVVGEHRAAGSGIMSVGNEAIRAKVGTRFFDPEDIAFMRRRVGSPGPGDPTQP